MRFGIRDGQPREDFHYLPGNERDYPGTFHGASTGGNLNEFLHLGISLIFRRGRTMEIISTVGRISSLISSVGL